jgi:hypothetical protein
LMKPSNSAKYPWVAEGYRCLSRHPIFLYNNNDITDMRNK